MLLPRSLLCHIFIFHLSKLYMSKIQVILLEDVSSLGLAGDIVSVSEGYARNYLFAEGKAALATESKQKEQRAKQAEKAKTEKKRLEELQQLASVLEQTELVLSARVKDGDDIYGHVTVAMVVKELNKQANLDLKNKDVVLPKPISKLGAYDVTVRLSQDVEAVVKVVVNAEEGSMKPSDDEE